MGLNTREKGKFVVVYLVGRIDVHAASEIEKDLYELVDKQTDRHVLLNLDEVEYMSSSGLRVFVSLMRKLKASERLLRICCLSAAVRKIFEVVELMDMFDIYESEDEAASAT